MIDLVVSNTSDSYQYDTQSVKDLCTIVLKDSNYDAISLNIIFSDDTNLSRLKLKYFNEDVLTDVLAFPLQNDTKLEAEIYISYDRAITSSKEFNVSLNSELIRLIVHGILHLLGYRDNNDELKKVMFDKQESIVDTCKINIV
ncbi:rRNA maturation RNase YbeY [bacterium]|nr:rRNA maturation RNase YbeY [bacterium]